MSLNEYSTWRDVLRFAGSQGDCDWVYIITGKPGPTGKTFLYNKLKENGYNAIEISEDTGRSVKYLGDRNTFNVNYEKKQVVIILNKTIYRNGSTPWNGRNEVGPAWDGFRAGAAEAEREIHGGFVTIGPEMPWDENKFKKLYDKWIKENPHTDIPSMYPKTHFIFPGRSGGKVLFTKADLKNGDIVKRRNGNIDIVCVDIGSLVSKEMGGFKLSNINNDLTSTCDTDYDIIAVRRCIDPQVWGFEAFNYKQGVLVYERKEVEEMTLEEVCKALGKEIKIVKNKE